MVLSGGNIGPFTSFVMLAWFGVVTLANLRRHTSKLRVAGLIPAGVAISAVGNHTLFSLSSVHSPVRPL